MADEKKLIAVVGATGAQGGGLARAILADPDSTFGVRAITRQPGGDKAKALAQLGAEIVTASLDQPESVRAAFRGAHGAFCVTNFWEHASVEREVAQGRALADAVKAEGVRHAIWSTLEDTRKLVPLSDPRLPTLQGKYKVPHFDGKGEIEAYFRSTGAPVTYLATSFYWENLIYFGMGPTRAPDGRLVLTVPMGDRKLAGIAAEDIGGAAYGIFKLSPSAAGRSVGISGDQLTGAQMAAQLSAALGREITYAPLSFDAYRKLGFPGADDLGNMFQYYHDFEQPFCAARDVDATRALHPGLLSFARWPGKYGQRIPIVG
ncbi:MAG TPA: NmrA/HSCARG family protein [Polyangia bacterium]|nr:NmrA/HSCARG family protein [Polyangia bacterium]